MVQTILRRPDVERVTGLARSTLYKYISQGTFPKPIRITGTASGWLESEIADWQQARIRQRDEVANLIREVRHGK